MKKDETEVASRPSAGESGKQLLSSRNAKKRGELAEMAFMYRASGLGFGVAKPYGDSERYDFIVSSGKRFWRVQVKSTCALQCGAYAVNSQRHCNSRAIPYEVSEIDFLVAHVVPEDAWFIIPVRAFVPRKSLKLYARDDPRGGGKYGQYREAWDLMRDGPEAG